MSLLSPPSPFLRRRPSSTSLTPPSLPIPLRPTPMFPALFSLFHFYSSVPPSPVSSCSDDLMLPLSSDAFHSKEFSSTSAMTVSTTSTTFSATTTPSSRSWWRRTPTVHAPILFVILLFPLSTALVVASLSTLPTSVSWPRNLADLAQLGRDLHGYSHSGPVPMVHVVSIMAITAIWKHAWSIPGSVVWNVLAGALFSPSFATILLTSLTTVGSACSTLLSAPFAPLLSHFFPRALELTRVALEGDPNPAAVKATSPAWVRLSVLRLVGVVPWSGINVACGVCGVPMRDCVLGAFIGTLPWTAVTCQIGDILQTVASTPSPNHQSISSLLASPWIIMKLVLLSLFSLAPILARDRLRALIDLSSLSSLESNKGSFFTYDERLSRWAWVHDWRSKIKLPSLTREDARTLDTLVREKTSNVDS